MPKVKESRSGMDSLIDRLQTILPELTEKFPMIDVLYLFGSRSSDTAREDSDVDLACFIDERGFLSDPLLDLKIGCFVEASLGLQTDAVILSKVSPVLQHEVLKTRIRLFEKDPAKRVRLELMACRSFLDARYYQQLRQNKELAHG